MGELVFGIEHGLKTYEKDKFFCIRVILQEFPIFNSFFTPFVSYV